MKKVLIIAYFFPPMAVSGAMRPLGFCRYLNQHGWVAHVLTTDPSCVSPPVGEDRGLAMLIPPTLRVDRIPYSDPLEAVDNIRAGLRPILRKFHSQEGPLSPAGVAIDQGSAVSHVQPSSFKRFLKDWLVFFPDQQRFWYKAALRWFSSLPSQERPDVIFATGKPWTGLMVGKAIAKKFDIPFVADFRDPLVGNPFNKFDSALVDRKMLKLEKAICDASERVVSTTEELRRVFIKRYPESSKKFICITNGFDTYMRPESLSSTSLPESALSEVHVKPRTLKQDVELELWHFGSISVHRNPYFLLQAIKEVLHDEQIDQHRIQVRFVGAWSLEDEACEGLVCELESRNVVRRSLPVVHSECLRQMTAAPMLLIMQPALPLQIPGKIYEYIATERPVLIIGGEGATGSLVIEHNLGHCCQNDVSSIKELLMRLLSGETKISSPNHADVARFDYQNLAGELANVLSSVAV